MTTERSKSVSVRAGGRRAGAARPGGQSGEVPAELRHEMIATAAYFRAEQRGFCGGESLDDWLAAESEVDERLRTTPPGKN